MIIEDPPPPPGPQIAKDINIFTLWLIHVYLKKKSLVY